MTIVLNEHEWAENMIQTRSLGDNTYETICRVAKYYYDSGYKKKDVRNMMDAFLLRCNQNASLTKWSDLIDYAVSKAQRSTAISIDEVPISKAELDKIRSLKGVTIQRLAFTLLCLAKYWDIVNPNGDHWVNCKDSDIMKMANIKPSIKRQAMLYRELEDLGMLQFSKKVDSTNMRVLFIEGNDCELGVSDYRNLGSQYMLYIGDDSYFRCQNCGLVEKRVAKRGDSGKIKGRPQKYCRTCAMEIHLKQNVNFSVN